MPATAMARFLALHLSSQPGQAQSRDDRQYTFKSAVDAWRELPDEQKKPFIDSYEQEIAVYKDLRAPLLELVRQKQKEVKDSLKTSK